MSVENFIDLYEDSPSELIELMQKLYPSSPNETNEERLGQLEMVIQTEEFRRKYPDPMGKDVASIVRSQLI